MTTTELAAVVVAGASVVGVIGLCVFLARLDRTVRAVGESVQLLRFPSVPLEGHAELAGEAGPSRPKLAKDPATLAAKVARANPVLDVSQPVIKVLALATGTSRAASRFRRTRRER
jgi:hypothetical protein